MGEMSISEGLCALFMRVGDAFIKPYQNRVVVCPACGGSLQQYEKADISEDGFAYRARICSKCGGITHTKQAPESITGFEKASTCAPG
ncbi:MAG: zf-TFIIB domain-containing protein [Deltaproteobacteria bacterium]|nr:zf-TFIIB domain-containing protein [Deltaproteobacteria bacterium]